MLVRIDAFTVGVHAQKDKFTYSIYNGTEKVSQGFILPDDWDSADNPLRRYLIDNGLNEVWDKLNEDAVDQPEKILASITKVVDYGLPSGVDLFFGDKVFRIDKDAYISPKAFLIWYLATMHRIPSIPEGVWPEFVRACLDISVKEMHDPLSPDLIERLIDSIKMGEIHSDFCDVLAEEAKSNAEGMWFVYRRDEDFSLYVPKHVCTALRKQAQVGPKKAREYWEPFLRPIKEDSKRLGKTIKEEERPRVRFWVFDMQKLAEYDNSISVVFSHVIDCSKHGEENAE